MSVSDYRDLIDELNRKATSLKSCVGDEEKAAWIPYAEQLRLQAWSVADTCKRATADDRAKMERARKALGAAYDSVVHLVHCPL